MDSLRTLGPSGFDPHASLVQMVQPAIWIYGGRDFSHPAVLSVENLGVASPDGAKDWTTVILPNANHDLIENGSICQTEGPLAEVLPPVLNWWERRFP